MNSSIHMLPSFQNHSFDNESGFSNPILFVNVLIRELYFLHWVTIVKHKNCNRKNLAFGTPLGPFHLREIIH